MVRAVWALVGLSAATAAYGQDAVDDTQAFFEAQGGYGIQFGTTPYVPEGDGTDFRHPLTNGPALGAAAGVRLLPDFYATLTYRFSFAESRSGEIVGVLDDTDASIAYSTLTAGLRPYIPVGPGRFLVEFGVGIVFPFETHLEYDYGAALTQLPEPITGSGERIESYNLGFGGHGLLGYELPIVQTFYGALHLRHGTFITNNNGEELRLRNFVTDFTAVPPTATTTTIEFDADGGERPNTYSVQDFRAHLAIGFRFL